MTKKGNTEAIVKASREKVRDKRAPHQPKDMNKKELLEARKEAYRLFLYSDNTIKTERIAVETGLSEEQVRKYRIKDKWKERKAKDIERGVLDEKIKDELEKVKHEPTNDKEMDKLQQILDESTLTDQMKLFVMFYLQSYNVTWAAKQSGYSKRSAGVRGNYLLKQPEVARVLNEIKSLMHENIYIRAHDIIDEYIKIAFSDMTEYVEFDDKSVRLKPSSEVDGRMITEVKQGRDGVTIKMADKMKALERLEKLFEIIPDRRLELEEKKFALVEKQANIANKEGKQVTIVNDLRS